MDVVAGPGLGTGGYKVLLSIQLMLLLTLVGLVV